MEDSDENVKTTHVDSESDKSKKEIEPDKIVENAPSKAGDGSDYESAEEDGGKVADKNCEESHLKDQESLSELVDEEGGEEGIAEPEDLEGDFLNDDQPDDCDKEIVEVEETVDEDATVNEDSDDIKERNDVEKVNDIEERNYVEEVNDIKERNDVEVNDIKERNDVEEVNDIEERNEFEEVNDIETNDVEEGHVEGDDVEEEDVEEGEEVDEGDEVDADDRDEADEASDEGDYADERQEVDEGSEEGEYVEEERQQGDGEECSPTNAVIEKELDYDEDRRNPQYIPKKGIFYEHDDRNNEDVKEKEGEPARDRKKKLWLDEGRWGHDRFRPEEQYPKSKNELIETYGYDIRNEDGPPRARRRRRYGRGPTKYERNWEDVTAYGREKFRGNESPRGISRGRRASGRFPRGAPRFRGRGRKEFITGGSENRDYINESTKDSELSTEKETKDEIELINALPVINSNEFPALPCKDLLTESEVIIEKRPFFQKSSSEVPESKSVRTLTFENSNLSGRNSIERDVPPLKSKPVAYGRQHDRDLSLNDKNINHLERHTHQFERNLNQYERNINQPERNTSYHDRNLSHHERNLNHHERNVNHHERNVNHHERNVNHHERNVNHHERNVNHHERNVNYHERNVNHHERNVSHLERNVNYHDRNTSHPERGARRPVSRGSRGSGRGDFNRRGRGSGMRHISPRFLENRVNNLNVDLEHLNIEDTDICNGLNTEKVRQIDTDVLPSISSESEINNMSVKGAGDSSSRPKRYSSLRQRSLPETTTYQPSQPAVPTQPSAYYEGGYQPALYAPTNTGVPTPSTQSQSATSPPLMNPSGFHPYDCGIRLQLLPRAIFPQPTLPAGQSVLAPPPPSPCIPPPNPNLLDFAAPPPPSSYHQYAYQQYAQPPPPPPPTAPNEIYQPGITYYFAQQTQSSSTRPTVQKRPKAAIPILPPPETDETTCPYDSFRSA